MRKVFFIMPLMLIMCLSIAFAATPNFYVTHEAINKDVFLEGDIAEFDVTITNLADTEDLFTFSSLDTNWNILSPQILIPAGEERTFELRIQPKPALPIGIYALNVKIKGERTDTFRFHLFTIHKKPLDQITGEYKPSIDFSIDIPGEVDPRKKVPVEIYLKNKNSLDVGNVTITIESSLFQDKKVVYLGPLEEKRIEYLYSIDKFQEPDFYSLKAVLETRGLTKSSTKNYEVQGYSTITQDSDHGRSFLFRTVETITLENLGNIEKIKQVNLKTPWLKKLFSSTDPKADYVNSPNGRSYEWNVVLQPQEVTYLKVTTNYRIPVILLLAIIILFALYYYFRSPVVLLKQSLINDNGDDGVEHLKIRLYVKNRSRKPLDNVVVLDRIPGIAEFVKKKSLGTIQPEKITKHDKKGTSIKWILETLEPFEERIITYELKSKLKIIGNVSLPSARVKFMFRNKDRVVFSNRIMVSK